MAALIIEFISAPGCAECERSKAALRNAFVLGMLVVHAALGLAAGFGGKWMQSLFGREWGLALGPSLIVLGLAWPGWIRLPLLRIAIRAQRATSVAGAAALGAPRSPSPCARSARRCCSCCSASPPASARRCSARCCSLPSPSAVPSPWRSAAGRWGTLEGLKILSRYQKWFEIAGVVVLIASGLYMLNAYFIVIPELAV